MGLSPTLGGVFKQREVVDLQRDQCLPGPVAQTHPAGERLAPRTPAAEPQACKLFTPAKLAQQGALPGLARQPQQVNQRASTGGGQRVAGLGLKRRVGAQHLALAVAPDHGHVERVEGVGVWHQRAGWQGWRQGHGKGTARARDRHGMGTAAGQSARARRVGARGSRRCKSGVGRLGVTPVAWRSPKRAKV